LDKSVEHLDTKSQNLRSNPVLFEVHKLVEKLLTECRATTSLGNRELLNPVIEVNVPPALIGDSAKILQILGYFLENSVKFTDKAGKIGVYVMLQKEENATERKSSGDGTVLVNFSIVDNGVGMSSDTHALLFKPLVQGDRYYFVLFFLFSLLPFLFSFFLFPFICYNTFI
jgi:signal transduction histidine kinase